MEAIRQRRKRQQWPTQLRAERARAEARQALQNKERESVVKQDGAETIVTEGQASPSALNLIGKSIGEMQEMYPLLASKYLWEKLQQTVTQDLLPAPSNWKEFAAADGVMAKRLGLDKPESSVTVSVWGSSNSLSQDLRDVEGQSRTVSDEERAMLE